MIETAKQPDRAGMASLSRTGLPDGMIAGLAAFAVLAALLNNFLRFNSYPLLRPEIAVALLILLTAAAAFGLVYQLADKLPRNWALVVRAGLEAGLILYVLNVNNSRSIYLLGATVIVMAVVIIARRSILPFVGVMAVVVLVAASFGIGQQRQASISRTTEPKSATLTGARAALPAVVHIILDEHIGPQGLPSENPGSPAVAQAIKSFYLSHGFRLFGGAHSVQLHTANSIPQILNFGTLQPHTGSPEGRNWRLPHNAYFDELRDRGYRIHVLQSDFLNYCGNQQVASCDTYVSQNFANLAETDLSPQVKAFLVVRRIVPSIPQKILGKTYRILKGIGIHPPFPDPQTNWNVNAINALRAMQGFVGELASAEPGNLYFAHILLPHFPYVTRPDCTLKPIAMWTQRKMFVPEIERQNGYADQLRCAMSQVDAAFRAVSASPAGNNFVMIVHGDHGSRITVLDPKVENIGRTADKDFRSSFSALFAVRAPGLEGGYDPRHFPLDGLLAEFADSEFHSIGKQPESVPTVVLPDRQWIPRQRVPLPANW